MKDIIIVGNGNSLLFGDKILINSKTFNFLNNLSFAFNVTFFQFYTKYSDKAFLQDQEIDSIKFLGTSSDSKLKYISCIIPLLKGLLKNTYVYIFFPGNLGIITAFMCLLLNKQFSVYIRGELGYLESILIRKAAIRLSVYELKNSIAIKPMIDFDLPTSFSEKTQEEINQKIFTGVFIGRVEKHKGILELIEAYSNKPNHNLRIIGEGPLVDEIKHNCPKNIQLLGFIGRKDDLSEKIEKADYLILPSWTEGFPRVIYEAMIFQTPIITTFVGGIPTIMKDDYNCLMIIPRNIKSILQNLEKIESAELRVKLIKNANTTITKIFQRKTHDELIIENLK